MAHGAALGPPLYIYSFAVRFCFQSQFVAAPPALAEPMSHPNHHVVNNHNTESRNLGKLELAIAELYPGRRSAGFTQILAWLALMAV